MWPFWISCGLVKGYVLLGVMDCICWAQRVALFGGLIVVVVGMASLEEVCHYGHGL